MIKLAVFDLDGTLLDTLDDLHAYMNLLFSRYSLGSVSKEKVKESIGSGATAFVEKCLPPDTPDKDFYIKRYLEILEHEPPALTRPFAGTAGLVEVLNNSGIQCAVLTNKINAAAHICIKQYFPSSRFVSVTGPDGFAPKPDPAAFLNMMKKLGVKPQETVMIGDGEPDAMVALNAGTKHIAALWGYRTRVQLEEAGAQSYADTPSSVLDVLQSFNITGR